MKVFFKKLLALIVVMVSAFVLLGVNTFASTTVINVVWSNPGENCSYEVSFSWQSTDKNSKIYICEKTEDLATAKSYDVVGESEKYGEHAFAGTYSFKFSLDGLLPETTYKYQIKSGDAETPIYQVTTASLASNFSFAWVSDIHTSKGSMNRINYANDLLTKINKDSGGINLIVTSGDEVSNGGAYSTWETLSNLTYNPILQTTMWASIPGNHTYYPDGGSDLRTNFYFEQMTNHPNNGYDEKSSAYWFLYNSVLFIALDSLTIQKSYTTLSAQQDWFRKVIAENSGKYQYIIVTQHFPWLNALTGAKASGYTSNYTKWYALFDEVGVDIALAGDYHTYYRSNRLYQDQPVDLNSKNGTVYFGNRQIGGRAAGGSYYIKERQNEEYFACRLDNPTATTSGCGYFNVTSNGISWKMYDHDTLEVVDSCFIPAKRGINWESAKTEVLDSTFFTASGTTGYVNFNTAYKGYVEKMEVLDQGGNTIVTVNPSSDKNATAILSGLEKNKSMVYTVQYTFADATKKNVYVHANTFGDYGEIYGFNVLSDGNKMTADFKYNLKNDVVKTFEIYQDETKVATITPDATNTYSGVLNDAKLDLNSQFILYAKNASGDIIYTTKKQYTYYGDINVSGAFDMADIDTSFMKIDGSTVLTGNALKLNDFNGDGVFDIGDVVLMYKAVKEGKTTYKDTYYTVTFLDFYGNVVSTQQVKEYEDATVPTFEDVSGFTFAYLNNSNKCITADVVIKAVYSAN